MSLPGLNFGLNVLRKIPLASWIGIADTICSGFDNRTRTGQEKPMSKYDQQCQTVLERVHKAGFTAIHIDFDSQAKRRPSGKDWTWHVSAVKADEFGTPGAKRLFLGFGSSFQKCYDSVMQQLGYK
jgi:hypothetical protein